MMMKIRIGPAGLPTTSSNILDGIETVSKLGLSAIEVEFVRGVHMGSELAKQVGKLAEKLDIRISVHAPYYINLCNPEKVVDSEKRILLSCERANEMNASVVVFHPGFYGKLGPGEAYEMVIKSCKMMAEHIKKSKQNVKLGLETTGKKSQFGNLEEIIKICKSVEMCVPVVDFSHIYARNGGKINYQEIFSSLVELNLEEIHCHFSGIEFTDSGERRHLPIGEGGPDFKGLAKEIMNNKISSTLICESPLLEKDALVMKKIFEKQGFVF